MYRPCDIDVGRTYLFITHNSPLTKNGYDVRVGTRRQVCSGHLSRPTFTNLSRSPSDNRRACSMNNNPSTLGMTIFVMTFRVLFKMLLLEYLN